MSVKLSDMPPNTATSSRTHRVTALVTYDEKQRIASAARRAGESESDYGRRVLVADAKKSNGKGK